MTPPVLTAYLRALIEMGHPLEVGTLMTLMTLRRGKTVAPGTVRWATSVSIGIEFIRSIHESEVLIHIDRPNPRS